MSDDFDPFGSVVSSLSSDDIDDILHDHQALDTSEIDAVATDATSDVINNIIQKEFSKDYLHTVSFGVNTSNLDATKASMDFMYFLKFAITTTYDGKKQNIPLDWPYIVDLAKNLVTESRLLILKARQILCSWVIVAYAVWECLRQEHLIILIISKDEKAAQEMIRRAYDLYDRLPEEIRAMFRLKDGPRNKESIEFNNRSRIVALPGRADATRSVSAKIIFIDEAAYARELADMLGAAEPALGADSKLFIVSTPNGRPVGRTFTELCKNAESRGYKLLKLHYTLCPTYNKEWEVQKRKSMTPQKFAHEFELSLASAGDSMIFAALSSKNLFNGSFYPNENYTLVRCIDPGGVMAVIWFAEDMLGNIVVYREKYIHGGSNASRAATILRLSGEEIYDSTIIDSADPQTKLELARCGVYSRGCLRKDVYETIDQINAFIIGNSMDTPIIQFSDDVPKLYQQMCDWVGDDCGYPIKGQYDHGIDALRYGIQIRVRLRHNRGMSSDIEQLSESTELERELDLGGIGAIIDGGSDPMGDALGGGREFSEADFDLGSVF